MSLTCWRGRCRAILTSGRKQQQHQPQQPLLLPAQVYLRHPRRMRLRRLSGSSLTT